MTTPITDLQLEEQVRLAGEGWTLSEAVDLHNVLLMCKARIDQAEADRDVWKTECNLLKSQMNLTEAVVEEAELVCERAIISDLVSARINLKPLRVAVGKCREKVNA